MKNEYGKLNVFNVLSKEERKEIKEALLNIRLSLRVESFSKPTIKKSKLEGMFDEQKNLTVSKNVKKMLDDVFDDLTLTEELSKKNSKVLVFNPKNNNDKKEAA